MNAPSQKYLLVLSALVQTLWLLPAHADDTGGPVVIREIKHDLSPPLRDLPEARVSPANGKIEMPEEIEILPKAQSVSSRQSFQPDPVVQDWFTIPSIPGPILTFDGMTAAEACACAPPDTNGDVGPNHYVETVNIKYSIYNKTGTRILGPVNTNTLWSGFGGLCESTNRGDPVVLYDSLANRWFVGQFAFSLRGGGCPNTNSGTFICMAVSQTPDPTGSYYRYSFQFPVAVFGDYEKFGVWPDGYYMTANQFTTTAACATNWAGGGVVAFERSKMIQGLSAQAVYFNLFSADPGNCFGGQLPSDIDGMVPPPAGTPNYFMEFDDGAWNCPSGTSADHVSLFKFHADWTTPANSTFGTATHQPNTILNTASFDVGCPGNAGSFTCVPQPTTPRLLDTLGDRLMHRLGYRFDGATEKLFGNFSVVTNNVIGLRWFEIRDPNGTPVLFQEGTYQPDTTWRWMGSIASDRAGNVAMGYSASSSTVRPSLRYAGRIPSDPAGTMGQGENTLFAGTGSQTGVTRWGDYSMLSVDPIDDCTFWYTNEYYSTNSSASWRTRIGDFKLTQCATRGAGEPSPIFLSKSGSNLVISWSALPAGCGNQDYALYKGSLTGLPVYNHAAVTCTTGNIASYTMPMPGDSAAYFIVNSESSFDEGSYGRNSAGTERPVSASACRAIQTLGACP